MRKNPVPPRLDVYSDVICPWCYIGKRNMEVALRQLAADGETFDVSWRPFQLNPDMPAGGVEREKYRRAKFGSLEHAREMDGRVADAAAAAGLPIRFDLIRRTPNTLDAHRLIQYAAEAGCQGAVVEALFTAYFVEGRDVGDRDTLLDIAVGCGLHVEAVTALLAGDGLRREVEAEDRAVREAGLTGVPAFALQRHVLFSGAVPPDVFAEALTTAKRTIDRTVA